MKEEELNATMSVIADPINNVQANKHKMLSIKNLATFRLVLSNN